MYVSSRLTGGVVFAVALALALWNFGIPNVQAKTAQHSCPTPTCMATPAPPLQSCLTCPVDPKEVKRQQKEAEHAAHEAAEEQARMQKEAEHAQHEAAEDCERRQKELAHAQHEADEARAKLADKQAKVNDLSFCCLREPVMQKTETTIEIERAKPEPLPEPEPAPVVTPTPEPMPTPEAAPAPEPTPPPVMEEPKELPETSSPMGLIGFVGVLSMTGWLRDSILPSLNCRIEMTEELPVCSGRFP